MTSENVIGYKILHSENSALEKLRNEVDSLLVSLASEYIWQKEEFSLSQVQPLSGLHYIGGSIDVGENINDEWFIVFLLNEISKLHPRAIVQVSDTDGEFLLIEAADVIPSSFKPDNCINRVFLCNGKLHLIPTTQTLRQAYDLVTSQTSTEASQKVQSVIEEQINKYPEKYKLDFHHTNCLIPQEIVYVLLRQPKMVAAAVQAFYERDAIDVKACRNLPSFNVAQTKLKNVRFTRYIYSQLTHAQFLPPKDGPWKLPLPNHPHYKSAQLGYKLTCGFQILLDQANISQEEIKNKPCGRSWEQYLASLKKNDYFKGEMEGSKLWNKYMEDARKHFKESVIQKQNVESMGYKIHKLMEEASSHLDEIEKHVAETKPDDDDHWLIISPEELDSMMLGKWGNVSNKQQMKEGAVNLHEVADSINNFVHSTSSYKGVETGKLETSDDVINFEADLFTRTINQLLGKQNEDEDSISCSDEEETDEELIHLMGQMDDELASKDLSLKDDDSELMRNLLESFNSQDGLAGPVSSMLNSMGLNLPPNTG